MTQPAARTYSFEFFPPKTEEGAAKLRHTVQQLGQLKPHFFSVTYGAGGTTREGTLRTVLRIRDDGFAAAPHLSCVASTRAEILEVLHQYKDNGIRHLVWDAGYGLELPQVYLGGYVVLGVSVGLTVLTWLVALIAW